MTSPEAAERLARELAAVADVQAALEAERTALETRDATALFAAVERKTAALARSASLARQRPVDGLADYRADPSFALLVAGLRRCRVLNEGNGALIRGQRRRVDGLLGLLTGTAGDRPTYGPDGAAAAARRSRGPLASA